MDTNDAKEAWHAQPSRPRLATDAGSVIEDVRRDQRAFAATIFWRDVREVGTCALMVPLWIVVGARSAMPWTWYLAVPAMLWVAGFMLADRLRHPRRPVDSSEPLRRHVERSLEEVEHQIWMLRNVFWWYLLPLALAMFAFVGQVAWRLPMGVWPAALFGLLASAILSGTLAGVYWINQHAVRADLEPRRRKLDALRASLADEEPAAG
ncbi:hypothetical protein OJF2_74290 [Aquisphaera giovannonii]|uniref:Uncharacterized protein n=1 Tax=Aquisphaera giovannonii TaxID=406548 RepID=A0A5B9WEZ0_9BACT|nr:hypothetical protein [Aquisphaera giovannonii]QEH38819.1 hypothetical protein OJF2_74290 [Aquisphaera giovannonii]